MRGFYSFHRHSSFEFLTFREQNRKSKIRELFKKRRQHISEVKIIRSLYKLVRVFAKVALEMFCGVCAWPWRRGPVRIRK